MSCCWEYEGPRDKHGYGRAGGGKLVHRLVFEAIYGWLPKVVRHRCDNPPCYRPDHLLPGTQADNLRDMADRGRNHQQKKTTCPQGHPYSHVRRGRRECKVCLAEQHTRASAKWRSKRDR